MKHYTLILSLLIQFTSALTAYELCVGAVFRNEGPFLKEWIEYHRMVGVEHFWLYNDESTDNSMAILEPYIQMGIVDVEDHPSLRSSSMDSLSLREAFISNQIEIYRKVIQQAKNQTRWLALIDCDEFLLPKKNKTVPDCLHQYFSQAAGVYVCWKHFGTGGVTLKNGDSLLKKLTSCAPEFHPTNAIGKSIIRPDCIDLDRIWYPHHFVLLPDCNYHYYEGDGRRLYFKDVTLELDGKVHHNLMQLNHYRFHDENYFQTRRLKDAGSEPEVTALLLEHYDSFNKEQDTTIMRFIRRKHTSKHKELWQKDSLFCNFDN